MATGNKTSFSNCNLSGTLAVTLPAEMVERSGFFFKIMSGVELWFWRRDFSFPFVWLIIYMERQSVWVCQCVWACFMVMLSKELKSLQRHYLIHFYYLCPGGICNYSSSTFRKGTWRTERWKVGPRSYSWPVDQPDKNEPLQPAVYFQIHLPLD